MSDSESDAFTKAGAVEFLAKPFRGQDFLDAVCAAIEKNFKERTANK